jgi:hypothetical protein
MPHAARPSIHVKPSKGKKGDGRGIPDFSRKTAPKAKRKAQPKSAKKGRRGK